MPFSTAQLEDFFNQAQIKFNLIDKLLELAINLNK